MAAPADVPEQTRRAGLATAGAIVLLVGAIVFLLAYDGGSYSESSRGSLAIGVWWLLVLAVAFALWPLGRVNRTALIVGGLLAALAAWTLMSTLWADSAENAFAEFNRAALYVGIFTLAVLGSTRSNVARWSDGLAVGIVATAGFSFFTRCFPDVLLTEKNLRGLPLDFTRLSYPLEYWNGLAIFIGLAFPLLLRPALASPRDSVRMLALAPFPVLGAAIFLTSSRGGALTAAVGTLALLVLAPSTRALEATVIGALGAAAGIVIVGRYGTLVNNPGLRATAEGHRAFAFVALACIVTAGLAFLSFRYISPRLEPRVARVQLVGRAIAAVAVVLVVAVGIAAAHPVRLFDNFTQPPAYALDQQALPRGKNPIRTHLLSSGSSGRWQEWGAALREFRSAPVKGRGAGSYEAWWAQHGTLKGFVTDAHSLYLETLGELGIVGFLLVVGAFLVAAVAGIRGALGSSGERRITVGALTAAFLAYAFAAGVDWMWEMTVVSVVGIALLGLISSRSELDEATERPVARRGWAVAARSVLAVVGIAVIASQAVSLITDRELQASKAAARTGDLAAAAKRANNARKVEPWAASPYLQLALVSEQTGDNQLAARWIQKAISRDRTDWRLWLVAARLQTKLGNVRAAQAALREFIRLNPRSDLVTDLNA
jgi:O-antigen ligase/polysaccharide polymerase Wzy-like membrane protein/tetratricopeptide repeat protein